jgi:hypothetical protein
MSLLIPGLILTIWGYALLFLAKKVLEKEGQLEEVHLK